ncbi:hypothetical protein DV735_g2891, partial [Chaetothyriales sp. CBS 134920]
MAEKEAAASAPESDPAPKSFSLFRLIVDQARVNDEILHHTYAGSGTESDPYVVTFLPADRDPGNPFSWPRSLRWFMTAIVALETLSVAFASSAFSGTLRELLYGFHVSLELLTAGISLFVLGFAVGPLFWAPLSEIFGRQIIFFITFGIFTLFNAVGAGANNIASLLAFRFLAGAFGSSPLTNGGGVIADIFPANERGLAMALLALAPSMGPCFGPAVAGFLGENEGWRWVMGLLAIFSGVLWIGGSLFVPETYAPVILRKRAAKLSQMTGKVYMTKTDIEKGPIKLISVMKTALVRPWILLFMEPIVLILSIYLAIIYGTLYLLFGAFPIVFQQHRGWSEGVGGLAFCGVAVGMLMAVVYAGFSNKQYVKTAIKAGGIAPAEARLPPSMLAAVAIPVGMFWFAWTALPPVHWIVPIIAGVPFGFGLCLIFLVVTNYLIDAYTIFAASVLAANTVLRSLFGAAFPLFTHDMYNSLGVHWASSVPAFLALACLPAPFIFYKYGAQIRARCVYASASEAAMNELRARVAAPGPGAAVAATGSSESRASEEEEKEEAITRYDSIKTGLRARTRTNSDPRVQALTRVATAGSLAEAAQYEASPFDVDRDNTLDTFTGLDVSLTRTRSRATRAE